MQQTPAHQSALANAPDLAEAKPRIHRFIPDTPRYQLGSANSYRFAAYPCIPYAALHAGVAYGLVREGRLGLPYVRVLPGAGDVSEDEAALDMLERGEGGGVSEVGTAAAAGGGGGGRGGGRGAGGGAAGGLAAAAASAARLFGSLSRRPVVTAVAEAGMGMGAGSGVGGAAGVGVGAGQAEAGAAGAGIGGGGGSGVGAGAGAGAGAAGSAGGRSNGVGAGGPTPAAAGPALPWGR